MAASPADSSAAAGYEADSFGRAAIIVAAGTAGDAGEDTRSQSCGAWSASGIVADGSGGAAAISAAGGRNGSECNCGLSTYQLDGSERRVTELPIEHFTRDPGNCRGSESPFMYAGL